MTPKEKIDMQKVLARQLQMRFGPYRRQAWLVVIQMTSHATTVGGMHRAVARLRRF